MKKIILLTLMGACLLSSALSHAQQEKNPAGLKPISPDCNTAIHINISETSEYGPTRPPRGSGHAKEIQTKDQKSLYSFIEEHNSAWYCLNIWQDGELTFLIKPENQKDDYDFLLFDWSDGNFCRDLKNGKIKPIRSNLSRTGKGQNSQTGLSCDSQADFVRSGPSFGFSKPLSVKKNERYYLVLDNVYNGGSGHTLAFSLKSWKSKDTLSIAGTILGEEGEPIQAEIILENKKGVEIAKTQSDPNMGKYDLLVPIVKGEKYILSFISDQYFIESKEIYADSLEKADYQFRDIRTVLPKLKKGKKYVLGAINFYGNSSELIPESKSSVDCLFKLLKKNPKMTIQIEGHVNDPLSEMLADYKMILSKSRAQAVYNHLAGKGISKERMSFAGFGSAKMLYPEAKSEAERQMNRRVEINVISLE